MELYFTTFTYRGIYISNSYIKSTYKKEGLNQIEK